MLQALKVENSPFSEQQVQQLQQSFGQLDPQQSLWLSGYLAGSMAGGPALTASPARLSGTAMAISAALSAAAPVAQPSPAAAAVPQKTLNILYASQTGNGEFLAQGLAQRAEQAGLTVQLQSLNEFRLPGLKKLEHAVFVMSTHGEGDPPDDAIDLFEFLASSRAPKLAGLKFRVLSLGDSSYEKFCECGRELETLLLAQGASTFGDRVDCDVEYETDAQAWSEQVLDWGKQHLGTAADQAPAQRLVQPQDLNALEAQSISGNLSLVPATTIWSRSRPFPSIAQRVQKITGLESGKDVFHIELSLEDSGLRYSPGDSLGVWAFNNAELVSKLLRRLDIDPGTRVALDERNRSVRENLTRYREITRLTVDTVRQYAALAANQRLNRQLDGLDEAQFREFIEARQLIDLVEAWPPEAAGRIDASALVGILRPLAPRSYSIASSQSIVDEEVHLTVATLRSNAIGQQREGAASQYLNHELQAGDQVGVFVEPNRRFRLPEDPTVPVIMIGAGTGVAPYRAFMQEIEEQGDERDSWLIFGNPHQRTDFLYQREWLKWRDQGLLSRIDVAFSRDQPEKYYVQHVISEQAERLNDWMKRGAVVYVCGCLAMGHEVERAIAQALARARTGESEPGSEQLAEVLSGLRRERKLLKDLY